MDKRVTGFKYFLSAVLFKNAINQTIMFFLEKFLQEFPYLYNLTACSIKHWTLVILFERFEIFFKKVLGYHLKSLRGSRLIPNFLGDQKQKELIIELRITPFGTQSLTILTSFCPEIFVYFLHAYKHSFINEK